MGSMLPKAEDFSTGLDTPAKTKNIGFSACLTHLVPTLSVSANSDDDPAENGLVESSGGNKVLASNNPY